MDQNNSMVKESSPFDKLPDELVLKIIKSAMEGHETRTSDWDWTSPHDFLLKTIARTSSRFRRIAADKSLWSGEIVVSGRYQRVKRLIREFLGKNPDDTHLVLRVNVGPKNFINLSYICHISTHL